MEEFKLSFLLQPPLEWVSHALSGLDWDEIRAAIANSNMRVSTGRFDKVRALMLNGKFLAPHAFTGTHHGDVCPYITHSISRH